MLLIALVLTQGHTGSPIGRKGMIHLEPYRSSDPNLMVPGELEGSIILLEKMLDNYPRRDIETARKRKRADFLNTVWIDPEKRKKRKRAKRGLILHDISDDDDLLDTESAAFLKSTGEDIS